MVKIKVGNLLEAEEDIICHSVNCQRVMGSGVARAIREKYPIAYEDYMIRTDGVKDIDMLGHILFSKVGEVKYVCHLFTQRYYGRENKRYTSYDAMYDSLKRLKRVVKDMNKSVAFPYGLGSVRGGADWDIVLAMIEKIFKDDDVTIYKLE